MSEENVEIVRGLYDTLNVGGAEAVGRLLAPDVVSRSLRSNLGRRHFTVWTRQSRPLGSGLRTGRRTASSPNASSILVIASSR